MATVVWVYIIPGAFHTPASYFKMIDSLKRKMRVMSGKYEIRIKCLDFERSKYLKNGTVPTMETYIEKCKRIMREDYQSVDGGDCKVIVISHSMGSRLSQMIISRLIENGHINSDSILGMIHIAGTLLKNGQNYNNIAAKQDKILESNIKVDPWDLEFIGENQEWIRINSVKTVYQYFLNDMGTWSNDQAMYLVDTLEPEIASNMDFRIQYNEDLVNPQKIEQLYIQTQRDNCIDITLQQEMCDEFGIGRNDIVTIDTGHEPFISKPLDLSRHICKFIQRMLRTAAKK